MGVLSIRRVIQNMTANSKESLGQSLTSLVSDSLYMSEENIELNSINQWDLDQNFLSNGTSFFFTSNNMVSYLVKAVNKNLILIEIVPLYKKVLVKCIKIPFRIKKIINFREYMNSFHLFSDIGIIHIRLKPYSAKLVCKMSISHVSILEDHIAYLLDHNGNLHEWELKYQKLTNKNKNRDLLRMSSMIPMNKSHFLISYYHHPNIKLFYCAINGLSCKKVFTTPIDNILNMVSLDYEDQVIFFCQDGYIVQKSQCKDNLTVNDMIKIDNMLPLRFTSKKLIEKSRILLTCSDLKQFSCLLEVKKDHTNTFRMTLLVTSKTSHLYILDKTLLLSIDNSKNSLILLAIHDSLKKVDWINVSCKAVNTFHKGVAELWKSLDTEEMVWDGIKVKKTFVFDSQIKHTSSIKHVVIALNSLFFMSGLLIGERVVLLEILDLDYMIDDYKLEEVIYLYEHYGKLGVKFFHNKKLG